MVSSQNVPPGIPPHCRLLVGFAAQKLLFSSFAGTRPREFLGLLFSTKSWICPRGDSCLDQGRGPELCAEKAKQKALITQCCRIDFGWLGVRPPLDPLEGRAQSEDRFVLIFY